MPDRRLHFWFEEAGLVTLEWVALAAAVIVLGVGVVSIIRPSENSAASIVGSNLVSTVQSNN